MIELLAAGASVGWFASLSFLLGASLLLLGVVGEREALTGRSAKLHKLLLLAAVLATIANAGLLLDKAVELSDGSSSSGLLALILRTRFGLVWLCTQAAAVVMLGALVLAAPGQLERRVLPVLIAVLAGLALLAAPFASHSAGADRPLATIAVHGLHHLALAAWFGGVTTLLAAAFASRERPELRAPLLELVRGFSRRAPWLMAVIVVSGMALAWVHVGRWPALFATRYGVLLLLKLTFLAGVLTIAWTIRSRLSLWGEAAQSAGEGERYAAAAVSPPHPALRADLSPKGRGEIALALALESGFGLAVFAIAALLAETVPGVHDEVVWWLPFRFSIAATWRLEWVPARAIGGAVVAFLALCFAVGEIVRGRRRRGALVGGWGAALGALLALPALAVPAFPDTYRGSEVPYHAVSIAHGRELYREHCVRCHGEAGRGDGPLAKETARPPANLTEPHTADHTAGDMFWWLTYGIEDAGMPPFADALSPEDRWDLINYLRAFAAGHQARVLGPRLSPGRPWLSSIDFNYATRAGERGILRDFRGRAVVLLVLFTPGASDARLARLRERLPEIRARGGELLAIPFAAGKAIDDRSLPIVDEGAEEIATSYLLLRRTFASPGNERDDDRPAHLEFLIDRFGYVRARWRGDEEAERADDESLLLEQIAELAAEPEILPPPDEHVH